MDVFAEAEGLKRRRALLERLQQQAQQPNIQGPKGYAIAQALTSLATQQRAQQGLKQVEGQEQANRQQYGSELGSELERFMQRQQGQSGEHELPPELVGPQVPGVPADPRGAVFQAMASRFPEMQSVGKAGLAEMLKKPAAPDDWKIAPDGTPYRTGPNGEFIRGPGSFGKPDKPLVQIDNYPKAAEKVAEDRVKALLPSGDYNKAAAGHQANLVATTEALAALKQGASTGQFEPFFQGVRKLLSRFGVENAATTPTDQLSAVLAQRTLSILGGKLGGQVSNTDLQFVKDMSGSTSTDPNALKRLLAIGAAASLKELSAYNAEVDDVAKMPSFSFVKNYTRNSRFLGAEGDPEFDLMLQNVWNGRPSVEAAPPKPPSPPGVPAKPAGDIDWKDLPRGR